MPDVFRLIDLERIDKSFGVVEPDMAAEPTLGIFDFRQKQQRFHRLQDAGIQQAKGSRRAADQQIKIAHAGGVLGGDLVGIGWPARVGEVKLDTGIAFGKYFADRFAQLRARRKRRDELAFLPGGFDGFFPFR